MANAAANVQHVDPITKVLGNFGKWQLRTMLIIFLCKVPTSWFMAIIIFTAPAPNPGEFWCTPPDTLPAEYIDEWISKAHEESVDRRNRTVIDYCSVYVELMERPLDFFGPNKTEEITSNMTTVECTNVTFNSDFYSLVNDFEMVCGRKLLVALSQCFHIFGFLIGTIASYIMLK